MDKDCIWNFLNENEYCKQEIKVRMDYRKLLKKNKIKKHIGFYKELLGLDD